VYPILVSSWDPILIVCFSNLGETTQSSIFLQTTGLQSKVARVEETIGDHGSSTTKVFFSTLCSQQNSYSRFCLQSCKP
jgi:hypothetical protein